MDNRRHRLRYLRGCVWVELHQSGCHRVLEHWERCSRSWRVCWRWCWCCWCSNGKGAFRLSASPPASTDSIPMHPPHTWHRNKQQNSLGCAPTRSLQVPSVRSTIYDRVRGQCKRMVRRREASMYLQSIQRYATKFMVSARGWCADAKPSGTFSLFSVATESIVERIRVEAVHSASERQATCMLASTAATSAMNSATTLVTSHVC
jgi:hypothetical protein